MKALHLRKLFPVFFAVVLLGFGDLQMALAQTEELTGAGAEAITDSSDRSSMSRPTRRIENEATFAEPRPSEQFYSEILATNLLIQGQPSLILPFRDSGFFYLQGPHGSACPNGNANCGIDTGTPDSKSCTPNGEYPTTHSSYPTVAVASGTVWVDRHDNETDMYLVPDGYPSWKFAYVHTIPENRFLPSSAGGTYPQVHVNQGDVLGWPACMGSSESWHLHFALWTPTFATGIQELVMSGWRIGTFGAIQAGRTAIHGPNGEILWTSTTPTASSIFTNIHIDPNITRSSMDYNGDGKPDLYGINKIGTGAGDKTEVHIMDGANQYKSYLLNAETILGSQGTDGRWDFGTGSAVCEEGEPAPPTPPPPPQMTVTAMASATEVMVGQSLTIGVSLENPLEGGTIGFGARCYVNPSLLKPVLVSPAAYYPDGLLVNEGPGENGVTDFGVSLQGENPTPVTAGGLVFSETFIAQAPGEATFHCESTEVIDSAENEVAVPFRDVTVQINEPGTTDGTVTGTVKLSHCDDASGAIIKLLDAESNEVISTTTQADGDFTLVAGQGTYSLWVERAGHLPARRTVTLVASETVSLPVVTLLYGDLNGDGTVIDEADVLILARWFNEVVPPAPEWIDATGDLRISSSELRALAKFIRKTGPQSW